MMDRRRFLLISLVGVLARPLAAEAQQAGKVWRVAVLYYGGPTGADLRALLDALRELGWVDGRNIVLDIRYAEGVTERFAELAAAVARQKPDLIVATSTPGIAAAKNVTSTVPIVMLNASDPVGAGLVSSLAHPGGNITGLSLLAPELSLKRVDLLKQAAQRLTRLGVLWNVQNPGMQLRFREVSTAAPGLGLQVLSFGVRNPSEFDEAFGAMQREHPEALLVMADTVTMGQRHRTVAFAGAHRLPALYESREFVDVGGLMSYGISSTEHYRRGAVYVDRILKGTPPGDLPIEQPTKFELVINRKTAKALGLTLPPSLLLGADQVIE
jgi:putative ABC transport system substrate-binding protein